MNKKQGVKRFFGKKWSMVIAVVFLLITTFGVGMFAPGVSADKVGRELRADNPLQTMAEDCHDLTKTDDKESPWKACEAWQDLVSSSNVSGIYSKDTSNLGCDPKMFYGFDQHPDKQDPSVTKTLWYTTASKYLACVDKAQAALDKMSSSYCTNMRHDPANSKDDSPKWKACEELQDSLYNGLGCSDKMFEVIPGETTLWRVKADSSDEVTLCGARIVDARQAKLTAPDGTKAIAKDTPPPPAGSVDGGTESGGGGGNDDVPCTGGALGWVLCPLINVMADGIRAIANFIDSMLQFDLLAGGQSGPKIKGYWENFVGLANIMLVIAFLVIIYSQATGAGLSNYNIKRMLPRIVLAAIAINISFYICALAIDISNIVGNSVLGFVANQKSISDGIADTAQISGPGSLQSAVSLTIGAAIGVVLVVLFATPLLVGMLITFIILIARQVVLIALVLASPLAFAAWLLPNTESYFKKWKDLFVSMLVLYPIVMLVFGVALFSSKLISDVASTSDQSHANDLILGDGLAAIISLVVLAIPLLALPFILKSSNKILSTVGSQAGNIQKRLGIEGGLDKAQGGVKGFAKNKALGVERAMTERGGRLGRIGNYRTVKKNRQKQREGTRERVQEEAYYASRAGDDDKAVKRRNRDMGIGRLGHGGDTAAQDAERLGRQASGYADAKERGRLKEELEHETLKLDAQVIPGDVDELRKRLRASLASGDAIGTKALMGKLAQEGKAAVAGMGDDIQAAAGSGVFDNDTNMHRAVGEQRQADWNTIRGADPTLAGLNLTTQRNDQGVVTQSAGTSSAPVSADQLATMAPVRIQQLAAEGKIDHEMVGQAAASGALAKMDDGQRAGLETGLQGAHHANPNATGTAPTVQEIVTEHQARGVEEGVRRANAPPPPPPPPSDRRLKQNVIQVGSIRDIPLYKFQYNWSDQEYVGTMAQDIIDSHPAAVSVGEDGYYRVDYSQLGFSMQTYDEWKRNKSYSHSNAK